MPKRFVSIWFRYLKTDWFTLRQPRLKDLAFVLATPEHGRMVITAANALAEAEGVYVGMVVADARALLPALEVLDDKPGLSDKLLRGIGEWCIRYTPVAAVDAPDGLLLDASGCTHLWRGERPYLTDILTRLSQKGYQLRVAMADTAGAAWAVARYGEEAAIVKSGEQLAALLPLPPAALRLEPAAAERLLKLGLREVRMFVGMPRQALRKRFGASFLLRLDQAMGAEAELLVPVIPPALYEERLPCLEPVVSATGIAIALEQLLQALCERLKQEQKGLRIGQLKAYCVDGRVETIGIQTNRPSHHVKHLLKLFDHKIATIRPDLGIELFVLEASKVEEQEHVQETMWEREGGLDDTGLSELLDRVAGRIGERHILRYWPDEHYWPERSLKSADSFHQTPPSAWRLDRPRPLQLLARPEPIEVAAPIPDYPPMNFRYKGILHRVVKADGPERIEQEWWLQDGQHRDYYTVEDENGARYWVFRLGHYDAERTYKWFVHGFFA
ncbi:DNA polymerase Y family protein [Chitinophaga sedimenti]|uniref:Y-family DNA polymerase n=1 Tax=Chitinophaga sedimenti TaxID=2033606 RepID=UPI0020036690|nr:DNA polymerase Y family protein [Chitinophaga sedimenti]MCK7556334.1 DNA polymerase Y family protein [Chitinophaga sedimenti]